MATSWRSFASHALFDAWHTTFKTSKGYPLAGKNALTGQVQPLSTGATTSYTTPYDEAALDCRALINDADTVLPGAVSAIPTALAAGAVLP